MVKYLNRTAIKNCLTKKKNNQQYTYDNKLHYVILMYYTRSDKMLNIMTSQLMKLARHASNCKKPETIIDIDIPKY